MRYAFAVAEDVRLVRLDSEEDSLVHHVEGQVFERQLQVQKLDGVKEVLVLRILAALLVQRKQLVLADLLLK